MGADARKSPRSRVHLRVSYKRGEAVIEKYADNLSAGGLFVCDAEGLAPREQILLEMELPRIGVFRVNADVAHLVGVDDAANRRPGAGLQLKSPPNVFKTALETYLKRLERRVDGKVYLDNERWRPLLEEAGYVALPLPASHALAEICGDTSAVGILVPPHAAEQYRNALAFLGEDDSLVIAIDDKRPFEPVLAMLDDKLLRPEPTAET